MPSCLLNKGAYEYLKSTRDKEFGKILMFIMFKRMYSTSYEGVRYYECEYATYQFYHKGSVNINLDIYNPLWFMLD